jgi:hypothetical protein
VSAHRAGLNSGAKKGLEYFNRQFDFKNFYPVSHEMCGSLWDMDWFEDPIWRQDASKSWYLNVPVANSDDGEWRAPAGTPWGAYSPGGAGVTLWKGFQRRHARGMTLRYLPKAPN